MCINISGRGPNFTDARLMYDVINFTAVMLKHELNIHKASLFVSEFQFGCYIVIKLHDKDMTYEVSSLKKTY